PLPSPGSLGTVPPVRRYYGTLRLPVARLAALRFLRLAIPSLCPLVRPPRLRARMPRDHSGVGKPVLLPAFPMEAVGSPKFPGNPRDHSPCSPTPAGPGRLFGSKRELPDAAPVADHDEGSPRGNFGAQLHGV